MMAYVKEVSVDAATAATFPELDSIYSQTWEIYPMDMWTTPPGVSGYFY